MSNFEEGFLEFTFSERWNVLKIDEHYDYRAGIEIVDNTKAVDFLGIFDHNELYFIEVKDFRGHRIENRDRLLKGELPIEIAQKVRDSLACIIGAYHRSNTPETWEPYAALLCNKHKRINVIFWLEESLPPLHPTLREKALASTRTKIFKQKLAWLTQYVLVCGNYKQIGLPEVTVKSLSRS